MYRSVIEGRSERGWRPIWTLTNFFSNIELEQTKNEKKKKVSTMENALNRTCQFYRTVMWNQTSHHKKREYFSNCNCSLNDRKVLNFIQVHYMYVDWGGIEWKVAILHFIQNEFQCSVRDDQSCMIRLKGSKSMILN